ncbi:response regulator transcription factor [Paraburkholderia sp. J63]|uniref:response regulator transcription factor n=1 Tax=Paraburkholderia sp. J63 TaxID=2805434 RepID=UPI002ABDC834|nr:response regulator transcription factor [Paraburkholderia sp. J63]
MTQSIARSIVLIDDHPIVLEGLSNLLKSVPDYRVLGTASNEHDGFNLVREFRPDVVIVDLVLGDTFALKLIERIAAEYAETRVICMSMHSDAAYAEPVALAGALGYINKAQVGRTILDVIASILNGKPHFPPEVQLNLLRRARGLRSGHSPLAALSPREVEVLHLIGQGMTKQQIGERIGRSPNTVETHRSNIKRKLELQSNAELIRFATLNMPGLSAAILSAPPSDAAD